jgi:hypothetical protein
MARVSSYLMNHKKQAAIFIFIFSLLIRASLLIPVCKNNTGIKLDERAYNLKADGFHSILKDLVRFKSPQRRGVDRAYGGGVRPPVHSILLAIGFLFFGKSIFVARAVVVVISAMTSSLIFLLTTKLASNTAGNNIAGIFAAIIHIFYPSFLAFSHFLWSETAFIFFLLLSVYLTILITDNEATKKRIFYAVWLGIVLGLLALTRAASLTFLIIIPAWIFFSKKNKRDKIIIPVIVITIFSFIILPWEYTLIKREKRFVLLSTYSYRNLYIGNNQYVREGMPFNPQEESTQPGDAMREYARKHSIPRELAAKELAIEEITSHFDKFLKRVFQKSLLLWTFDFFPIRHLTNGVYPPMSDFFVLLMLTIFAMSHIFCVVFGILAFFNQELQFKKKALFVILVIAGMLPYVVAFGNPRFNLPQIALLVPLAGYGLAKFQPKNILSSLVSIVAIICLCSLFFHTYNHYIHKLLRPSSYYRGSINVMDKIFRTETIFEDVIKLKSNNPENDDVLTLKILNEKNYSFLYKKDRKKKRIRPDKNAKRISIYALNPTEPLILSIYSKKQNKSVELEPVSKYFWRKFRLIDVDNIALNWVGGD